MLFRSGFELADQLQINYYDAEIFDQVMKRLQADKNAVGGAGSFEGNHITRVFVRKDYQRHGVGSLIMQRLEDVIAREYESVRLEATLPAVIMFEKRGYRTIRHEKWTVRNGAVLVYPVMEKILRR